MRTEREHCCDDTAAAGSDPKLYAAALAALEGLRSPSLASAATGGPLLSRIRRLLVPDRAGGRDGLLSFTAFNLMGILVVLALAAVTLAGAQSEDQVEEEMIMASNEMHSAKVLEGVRVSSKKDRAGRLWFGTSGGSAFSTIRRRTSGASKGVVALADGGTGEGEESSGVSGRGTTPSRPAIGVSG